MLLLPAIFYVVGRWPFRWSFARVGIHVLTVIAYSAIHTSLLWGSRVILFPLCGLGPYDYGAMPVRYFMEFPSDVIAYAMWVAAYTVYHNWLRAKEVETQLVSARLVSRAMHQLQPHFLFNALNAVSAAMYEDVGRADRMIERICDFLRATLKLPDSPMVPLGAELALARQYLEVMKARLEDQLQFEIQCERGAESARVPALLLQPLVENAIEHGQDPQSGTLDVRVERSPVRRIRHHFDPGSRPRFFARRGRRQWPRPGERAEPFEGGVRRRGVVSIEWLRQRRARRDQIPGMIRVFLVEDEPPAIRKLQRMVAAEADLEVCGSASTCADAIDRIPAADPQVLILDIRLPDGTGFEILQALTLSKAEPLDLPTVFLTAYEEYAIQAFDVAALDYLLKPVSQERFSAAIQRVRARLSAPPHATEVRFARRFLVERRKAAYLLPVDSIRHIAADRNYALLYSDLGEFAIRATMDGLEKRLDPCGIRPREPRRHRARRRDS